jgi:hypothetical protein
MPAANPLAIFAPGLSAVGVPWAVVGSIASSTYGEFRTTRDVDVVALIQGSQAGRFARFFSEDEFYCPPADVIEQEANRPERGHFNVIHHETMFKADITSQRPILFSDGHCVISGNLPWVMCRFLSHHQNTLSFPSWNSFAKEK